MCVLYVLMKNEYFKQNIFMGSEHYFSSWRPKIERTNYMMTWNLYLNASWMYVCPSFLYFYSVNTNIKISDPINPDYTYQKWNENLMNKEESGN